MSDIKDELSLTVISYDGEGNMFAKGRFENTYKVELLSSPETAQVNKKEVREVIKIAQQPPKSGRHARDRSHRILTPHPGSTSNQKTLDDKDPQMVPLPACIRHHDGDLVIGEGSTFESFIPDSRVFTPTSPRQTKKKDDRVHPSEFPFDERLTANIFFCILFVIGLAYTITESWIIGPIGTFAGWSLTNILMSSSSSVNRDLQRDWDMYLHRRSIQYLIGVPTLFLLLYLYKLLF